MTRYLLWLKQIITKRDFGYFFAFKRPVIDLIWERMGWTVSISLSTIVFQWLIAVPLGIFPAFHPYKMWDYPTSSITN